MSVCYCFIVKCHCEAVFVRRSNLRFVEDASQLQAKNTPALAGGARESALAMTCNYYRL